MQNKQVTIVIPTFNRADLVSKTIDSALTQTVPCDIIVCDHGSTDNTPELMKKYENKILYIRREKDFGPHFCWLEGILHADTEYIHLHFDDDVMHSEFIEKTLSYMEPDVGMVFTEANVFNPYTDEVTISTLYNFKNKFKTGVYDSKILEKDFLKDLMLTPAICLYRKKDILDAILSANLPIDFGGNYHGVGADIMMNLLICDRYKKIAVIIEPLVTLGSHDGSITMDASKDREKNLRLIKGYDAFRRYYKLLKFYKNNFLFIKQIVNYGIKKRK